MAAWQRYPGAWTPEELGGRNEASAPPLGVQEDEEKQQEDPFPRLDGRAQRPPYFVANSYERRNPPPPHQPQYTRRQEAATQFPGYPAMPPQCYGGYSTRGGGQERHDRVFYEDQWTYQASAPRQPPVQQSTGVRGQWVSLGQQGPWVEGREVPGDLQVNGRYGHGHWGHRGRRRDPPLSPRSRTPGFLTATLKLCAYHVANVIFALVACGILSAGVCSAASLIPVCCIGLLIFQVLVYIVFSLAQWDIKLANYIAPAQQRAYASLLLPGSFIGTYGLSGYRISPSLAYFSPLSLMATLYFLVIKPVIGLLSFLAVLLVVAPTVSLITSLTSSHPGEYYDSIEIYGVGPTSMSRYPGMSLVGAICVTLVGIALMQLVAKISLGASRFFCCEKFAVTTRFAPYQSLANNGVASYGATSSTRS